VTRLIAGLTAIFAVTAGAMVSGNEGRALPAWLSDLAVLAVSGALLAIAIRFGALAYLLPAALGLIVALTDLNSQYVVERTGIGAALVVEGLILIGTGLVADRSVGRWPGVDCRRASRHPRRRPTPHRQCRAANRRHPTRRRPTRRHPTRRRRSPDLGDDRQWAPWTTSAPRVSACPRPTSTRP